MSFNLFSKTPRKPKKTSDNEEGLQTDSPRSKSPLKKSYSRSSKNKEEENIKSEEKQQSGSTKTSRIRPKSSVYPSRNSFDPNTTHPLNLPPDQLRRLSTQVRMSEPMDIDVESPSSARNPSPPPATNSQANTQPSTPKPAEPVRKPSARSAPAPAPQPSAPNGQNVEDNEDGPPPPPPAHKSNPTSPQAVALPTPEEAEAFKDAGNRYYKAKQYKKAIEEYSKGSCLRKALISDNSLIFYCL